MPTPPTLQPSGPPRVVPERMLGCNCTAPIATPADSPQTAAATADLGPSLLRFPGGTAANFFDWRTGAVAVPAIDGGSQYRAVWAVLEAVSREIHPDGVHAASFSAAAADAGAALVLVPNLETSSIEDQAEWFETMASDGVVPTRIELGNEFAFAMMGDPESMARFPDWKTAAAYQQEAASAFAPHLPPDASIAAQAIGAAFYESGRPGPPLAERCRQWDDDVQDEPWFDALTVHLYPELDCILGEGYSEHFPLRAEALLPALLARMECGVRRVVEVLTARAPSTSLWVTEWGAFPIHRGDWLHDHPLRPAERHGAFGPFHALWLHYIARGFITMLAEPAITVALYHGLSFSGGVWGLFAPSGAEDDPRALVRSGPNEIVRWFFEAVSGGGTWQPLATGAERQPGGGTVDEDYSVVAAALATDATGRRTLFVHNTSDEPFAVLLDLAGVLGVPSLAEATITDDLFAVFDASTPPIEALRVDDQRITVPPWSLARVVWDAGMEEARS